MKKIVSIMFVFLMIFSGSIIFAGEHGGKEHGGIEHGGKAMAEPTAHEIKTAMKEYVETKSKETGMFTVKDAVTGKERNLKLTRIHDRVGKTGNYFYSCADFTDTKSGELLDLDIDVESKDGKLNIVDVRIHKISGKERYTYDEKDNRIPVK